MDTERRIRLLAKIARELLIPHAPQARRNAIDAISSLQWKNIPYGYCEDCGLMPLEDWAEHCKRLEYYGQKK